MWERQTDLNTCVAIKYFACSHVKAGDVLCQVFTCAKKIPQHAYCVGFSAPRFSSVVKSEASSMARRNSYSDFNTLVMSMKPPPVCAYFAILVQTITKNCIKTCFSWSAATPFWPLPGSASRQIVSHHGCASGATDCFVLESLAHR